MSSPSNGYSEVLDDPADLPIGCHAFSFHASVEEAADHASGHLWNSPTIDQGAYWIGTGRPRAPYEEAILRRRPEMLTALRSLETPSTEATDGALRPIKEVVAWVENHPDGVVAAAETLSWYWDPIHAPMNIAYEQWFHTLERRHSRFLCPYDLRRVPIGVAGLVLPKLRRVHTHLVLSTDRRPEIRVMQLLAFQGESELPELLAGDMERGILEGHFDRGAPGAGLRLTPLGVRFLSTRFGRSAPPT